MNVSEERSNDAPSWDGELPGRARDAACWSGAEGRIVYPVRYSSAVPPRARPAGVAPGRARAAGAGEACTGRDGDHVAPDGGPYRAPRGLAIAVGSLGERSATAGLLRSGGCPTGAGPHPDPLPGGEGEGPALTPTLSQGERGRGVPGRIR